MKMQPNPTDREVLAGLVEHVHFATVNYRIAKGPFVRHALAGSSAPDHPIGCGNRPTSLWIRGTCKPRQNSDLTR